VQHPYCGNIKGVKEGIKRENVKIDNVYLLSQRLQKQCSTFSGEQQITNIRHRFKCTLLIN
jgi:hypothetical protein